MRTHLRLGLFGLIAIIVAMLVPAPASADGPTFGYQAAAGATKINALGYAIKSDMTAPSVVSGAYYESDDQNQVAGVDVSPLATVGVAKSDAHARHLNDGWTSSSHARTADVSILGGLIQVQAVDTVSSAAVSSTDPATTSSSTTFLGLVINGKKYPVSVPDNTTVGIPGIATVTLNATKTGTTEDSATAIGAGLVVNLLSAFDGVAAGARIVLNPTFVTVQPTGRGTAPALGGMSYAVYINAHAGKPVSAETGRLPLSVVPRFGTDGKVLVNDTAQINIKGIVKTEAVESTAYGVTTADYQNVVTTEKVLRLRVFPTLRGPLISADAIGSTSEVEMVDGEPTVLDGNMQFLNLKIAGQEIPVDVGPNTSIHIAKLGTVTINEVKKAQYSWMHGVQVMALHIVLDTARYGLPIGAEIQLGVTQAIVWD